MRRAPTLLFLVSLLSTAPPAALADAIALEEIVVTAQKRAENLQDVPIAITAISGAQLAASGIDRLRDFQFSVPNMVFGGNAAQSETFIGLRGVGDFARNMGFDSRVGVYVDGAFVGQSVAVNADLVGIERIEVLRGPQGTLFGKNTISGAISIATKKPAAAFGGETHIDVGNYGLRSFRGALDLPVSESVALRASGVMRERDGYVHNVFLDTDLYDDDSQGGRLQARFSPSEALEINLSFDALRERRRSIFLEPTAGAGFEEAPRVREVSFDVDVVDERDLRGGLASVDYRFDNGLRLSSISSLRHAERRNTSDEDASSFDVLAADLRNEWRHFTQELRLASPAGGPFEYVAGLYYFTQTAKGRGEGIGGTFFPVPDYRVVNEGEVRSDAYAAYVQGSWRFADRWELTGGVRYTKEEKDILYSQRNAEPLFPSFEGFRDELSDTDVSPTLGLTFRPGDPVMLYAKAARGYKSGGWNADFVSTTDIGYGSEQATSLEVGVKSTLAEGRMRLNAAVFRTRFRDFQVFQFQALPGGGTNLALTNAGKVTTKGVEVELAARLVRAFEVSFGVGYTDAAFDEFRDGGGIGIDFDGHRLANAPRLTSNLAATYRAELGNRGELYLRGEHSYRGSVYFNPSNAADTRADGFDLLNARIGYLSPGGMWEVALWGKNLADELYIENRGLSFLGVPFDLYGVPRTYGAALSVRF